MAGRSDCIMSLSRCAKLSVRTMENVASGTTPSGLLTSGSADFCIVRPGRSLCSWISRCTPLPAPTGPSAQRRQHQRLGEALQRRRLADLGFDERMIARLVRPFDSGDVRRAAGAPAEISIAGRKPHGLREEVHPIADGNAVPALERRQLAVAGVENRANRIAIGRAGALPRLARRALERVGKRSKRAAHMPWMRGALPQLQAWDACEEA